MSELSTLGQKLEAAAMNGVTMKVSRKSDAVEPES